MSTVTNPLSGLIDGLLQGHQLGMQMKRAADEHQAFITNQALHNQQMSIQDIMNKQNLEEMGARPVNNGTVTSPAVSASVSGPLGIPSSGSMSPDTPGGVSAAPAPSQADVSGGSIVRKADRSHTMSLKDSQGNSQDYELPTADEQLQRQVSRATAMKHVGMTPVQATPAMLKLGMSPTVWVPDEHLAQYAQVTGQMEPVPTPTSYQQAGGAAEVPRSMLPHVITFAGQAANRDAANTRADNANQTRLSIADTSAQTRKDVAGSNQDAANTRAANRNATTLAAAAARRDNPTPGQENVQNRFDQGRQDAAQKQMADVQAKEDAVHAQRLQLGQMLMGADVKDADRQAATGKMKALNFQVQAYQTRKAAIAGAQTPPKAIQDQIAEGKQATAPDGHTWLKKDGIVYFIK